MRSSSPWSPSWPSGADRRRIRTRVVAPVGHRAEPDQDGRPATPQSGGTLTFGTESEDSGWNPTVDRWDAAGTEIAVSVFDPLVAFDDELRGPAVPGRGAHPERRLHRVGHQGALGCAVPRRHPAQRARRSRSRSTRSARRR